MQAVPDCLVEAAVSCWLRHGGVSISSGSDSGSQRIWDDGFCVAVSTRLLASASPVCRARLLAAIAPGFGSWLHALPCANLGLRLGSDELRIAVGLRLGSTLVRPHK